MRREDALKKLAKLLGKNFRYRVDATAPDADGRAEAKAKLQEVQPVRDDLERQKNARMRELLAADAEYQRLKTEHAEANKHCEELASTLRHYRFTVGTIGDLFFTVRARGDSWEEVIAKVKAGK